MPLKAESEIIETIEAADGISPTDIINIDQPDHHKHIPEATLLTEVKARLITVLKQTGQVIFDDEVKYYGYQGILAVMYMIDSESDGDSESLTMHSISKEDPENHNPLRELQELEEPTIANLADRYNYQDQFEDSDWWGSNKSSKEIHLKMQEILAQVLLTFSEGHFPKREQVENHIVASMIFVDDFFGMDTQLELIEQTQSVNGIEFETNQIKLTQTA